MKKEELEKLWTLYVEFCEYAAFTQEVKSSSATDFLGWLKLKK